MRILTAPAVVVAKKGIFVFSILIGFWLIVGVSTYQTKHLAYEQQRSSLQSQIDTLYLEKQKLETLRQSHPTSRDVLFSLAEISYRLHDKATIDSVVQELQRLDPNSVLVKTAQEKFL